MTSEWLDGLVREYLLFRGFSQTSKAFEAETKTDKDRAFRPDKITDHLLASVAAHDIQGLRESWSYLDAKLFCRLEHVHAASTKRLEAGLFKFYLVQAHQAGRHDRVVEFFERLTSELQKSHDWRDWFAFPFLRNPEENPTFSMYFSKTWQESFQASLRNFVAIVIRFMPTPRLGQAEADWRRLETLGMENDRLKSRLHAGGGPLTESSVEEAHDATSSLVRDMMGADLMDDFAVIAQERNETPTQPGDPSSSSQTKTIKSFIRTITLPSSPNPSSSSSSRRGFGTSSKPERKVSSPAGPSKPAPTKPRSSSNPPETSVGRPSRLNANATPGTPLESSSEAEEAAPGTKTPKSTTPLDSNDRPMAPLQSPPFLLLSQEDYTEHPSSIAQVRFSPTGSHVASVDVDGVVKVWSARAGLTRATIMSKAVMTCVDWIPTGDRLLLHGNRAAAVRLFDLKENKSVSEASTESSFPRVHCVAADPRAATFIAASASRGRVPSAGVGSDPSGGAMTRSGILQLYDLRTFKKIADLSIRPGPAHVSCLAWNASGTRFLAGGSDGALRLYDVSKRDCVAQWQAHQGEVHTVEFSSDERRCFSMGSGSSSSISIWSITGDKEAELPLHSGAGGPFVLSGFGGLKQVHTPKGGLFRFDADKKFFLTCKMNGALLYKIQSEPCWSSVGQMALGGHKAPVVTLDWTNVGDCSLCATASMDGHIKVSTLLSQSS